MQTPTAVDQSDDREETDSFVPPGEGCYECNIPEMELPLQETNAPTTSSTPTRANVRPRIRNKLRVRRDLASGTNIEFATWLEPKSVQDHIRAAALSALDFDDSFNIGEFNTSEKFLQMSSSRQKREIVNF